MKLEEIERIEELKRRIALDQNGLCAHCGRELQYPYDLAHRISKSKVNLKLYGAEIIHHRINLRATHSGRCNDGVMVSPASNPVTAAEIIAEIRKAIEEDDPFYKVYLNEQ